MKISAEQQQRYKNQCDKAIEEIIWPQNIPLLSEINLKQALQMAKDGQKISKKTAQALEPANLCFHEWMDYAHMLTIYFNSCNQQCKYTILRIGCYQTCININYIFKIILLFIYLLRIADQKTRSVLFI